MTAKLVRAWLLFETDEGRTLCRVDDPVVLDLRVPADRERANLLGAIWGRPLPRGRARSGPSLPTGPAEPRQIAEEFPIDANLVITGARTDRLPADSRLELDLKRGEIEELSLSPPCKTCGHRTCLPIMGSTGGPRVTLERV